MTRTLRVTIDDGAYPAVLILTAHPEENGLHDLVLLDAYGNHVEGWESLDKARALAIIQSSLDGHYQEAMFGPEGT
jgi:hypothetical protein